MSERDPSLNLRPVEESADFEATVHTTCLGGLVGTCISTPIGFLIAKGLYSDPEVQKKIDYSNTLGESDGWQVFWEAMGPSLGAGGATIMAGSALGATIAYGGHKLLHKLRSSA